MGTKVVLQAAPVVGKDYVVQANCHKCSIHFLVAGGTASVKLRGGNISGVCSDLPLEDSSASISFADGANQVVLLNVPVANIGFVVTSITGAPVITAVLASTGV